MPDIRIIKSIAKEYGVKWLINRGLYSAKLKLLKAIPALEGLFEKKTCRPAQTEIMDIDVDQLRSFIRNLEEKDKSDIISNADSACEGKILGFSSVELDYGNPIDWQLNPLTGRRCNENIKWYKTPDFDKERGDIKVVWEASRFSFFITLARAFLLTEDRKYYNAFSAHLTDWLEKNPYSYGANFKCGQECAFRMANAMLSYSVFKKCGVTTNADEENIKVLVDRCYRKILSNFFYAYKCIKNNHTISELMGMMVGAWCCEDKRRLKKAYTLLDKVIDEQFTDDGGYCQLSFNYQRLAMQDIEFVLAISARTEMWLSKKSIDKIYKSALLMYQCQDNSFDMPNYGANDGALVFPISSCEYRDFRPVINAIYALTTGKQLYESGKHQEELIWFSSGRKPEEFKHEEKVRCSSQFPKAGLFTLRAKDSWMMVVSNEYHSRPLHMDQNHVDLWIRGVNVLCDAGTFSYAASEGRDLVKNASHNTAVIDDVPQMNSSGSFMIYDWTKREVTCCDDDTFEGRIVSLNGYDHFRRVKKTAVGFEIEDKVSKDYHILFHTPCEVSMENGKAILSVDGEQLCEISSDAELRLKKEQRSLYYLRKEPDQCIWADGQAGKVIKISIEIRRKAADG